MDKMKFLERQYKRNHSRIVGLCYRYVNDFTVAGGLGAGCLSEGDGESHRAPVYLQFRPLAEAHCREPLHRLPASAARFCPSAVGVYCRECKRGGL